MEDFYSLIAKIKRYKLHELSKSRKKPIPKGEHSIESSLIPIELLVMKQNLTSILQGCTYQQENGTIVIPKQQLQRRSKTMMTTTTKTATMTGAGTLSPPIIAATAAAATSATTKDGNTMDRTNATGHDPSSTSGTVAAATTASVSVAAPTTTASESDTITAATQDVVAMTMNTKSQTELLVPEENIDGLKKILTDKDAVVDIAATAAADDDDDDDSSQQNKDVPNDNNFKKKPLSYPSSTFGGIPKVAAKYDSREKLPDQLLSIFKKNMRGTRNSKRQGNSRTTQRDFSRKVGVANTKSINYKMKRKRDDIDVDDADNVDTLSSPALDGRLNSSVFVNNSASDEEEVRWKELQLGIGVIKNELNIFTNRMAFFGAQVTSSNRQQRKRKRRKRSTTWLETMLQKQQQNTTDTGRGVSDEIFK